MTTRVGWGIKEKKRRTKQKRQKKWKKKQRFDQNIYQDSSTIKKV